MDYVISGRSMEAVSDMTETLMQHLRNANRIRSRRMEAVSTIKESDIPEYRAKECNKITIGF